MEHLVDIYPHSFAFSNHPLPAFPFVLQPSVAVFVCLAAAAVATALSVAAERICFSLPDCFGECGGVTQPTFRPLRGPEWIQRGMGACIQSAEENLAWRQSDRTLGVLDAHLLLADWLEKTRVNMEGTSFASSRTTRLRQRTMERGLCQSLECGAPPSEAWSILLLVPAQLAQSASN